jgi:hypothetical protein
MHVLDALLIICTMLFLIGIVAVAIISSVESNGSVEQSAADLERRYGEEAAQYRALARKLDAETELDENFIKTQRASAVLDDIGIFRKGRPRRRRRRRAE